MAFETVLTENRNGVWVITMNRPERLNAWTYQMGGELRQAIAQGNNNDDVLAMVLTGAGRGFCAGADIEAVFKAQDEGQDVASGGGAGPWVNILRESKPMVAAVNGAAVGVGLTQILPMDYILASTEAKLSMRFVKMGLIPELASSHYLFARVGWGHASELMLSGRTLLASEAKELGLIDRVVDADQLLKEACSVALGMGENPQGALRQIKALITANASETNSDEVQRREMHALNAAYASPEHKEAIAAFMEKREPDFKSARNS